MTQHGSTRRRGRKPISLIITCEHGGNRIPAEYRIFFKGYGTVLASHRGHDPGALTLAQELSRTFNAPLVFSTVSRLLIDLNRSPRHPALYSERTRDLSTAAKERIIGQHYEPYRRRVQEHIEASIATGHRVLHLSSHSFTPIMDGVERNADIGLLYDPKRRPETGLCSAWSALLAARIAPLRVRRNYPYRGYNDGLTTLLRRRFHEDAYMGVEIEINQKHPLCDGRRWQSLRNDVVQSVSELLDRQA